MVVSRLLAFIVFSAQWYEYGRDPCTCGRCLHQPDAPRPIVSGQAWNYAFVECELSSIRGG
jgi:hypothetical protein